MEIDFHLAALDKFLSELSVENHPPLKRKPRRPVIQGIRPEGRPVASVCHWCFDLPHRRVMGKWTDPITKVEKIGCPGCGKPSGEEESEMLSAVENRLEQAAWELLEDQNAREHAGVQSFREASRYIVDAGILDPSDPIRPEGKTARYCNVCFGLAHRRPPLNPCPGCGGHFAIEALPVPTMQSTLCGADLEAIS